MRIRYANCYRSILAAGLLLACSGCPAASDSNGVAGNTPLDAVLAQQTTLFASSAVPACVQGGVPASPTHQAMLAQLNQYRKQHGLSQLIYSKRLEAAADYHVKDLYDRGYFEHVDPDGKNPGDRALDAQFCHKYVGENIAAGQRSVDAVMEAWKNSPGHNANMLDADYLYVGMGYYIDPTGRQYWGQEFALDVP